MIKKTMGILLSACVVLGGVMADGTVVCAYDHGEASEYCEEPLTARFFALDQKCEEINKKFDDSVIGVRYDDGTTYPENPTSQTKYWVPEAVAEAYWEANDIYMWGENGKAAQWEQKHYMWDDDTDGNPNWNEDGMLTSIKRSELLDVINKMEAVVQPIWSRIHSQGSGKSKESEKTEKAYEVHVHNWVEVTVREATAETDQVVTMQCTSCGAQQTHKTIPGTAVGRLVKDVIGNIEKAPAGGTVTVGTDTLTCFNRAVIEALKARQDVTVIVNFKYQGAYYTFTVPAGYGADQLDALLDENGYCGFMYLITVFSGAETVK